MPSSPPRRRTPAPFLSRASRRCRWPRPSAWRRRPPRVEVDRHHRFGAYGRGLCGHVLEGMLLGITQGLLVAAGASADDIAYPREDVAEQVGADDCIAGDDAQVLDDPRSEVHSSDLPSLMRISYAFFSFYFTIFFFFF